MEGRGEYDWGGEGDGKQYIEVEETNPWNSQPLLVGKIPRIPQMLFECVFVLSVNSCTIHFSE